MSKPDDRLRRPGALAQGFAVTSFDAGHTSRQNPRFGAVPQARADYGYQAVGTLTPMALIAGAYGKAPDRSYDGFKAMFATDATFRESADTAITMPSKDKPSNLAPLRAQGAKMLLYHGVGDAIFSADDTLALMQRLTGALGGSAADFARYFPVPSMAHCQGGPATDQFDALGPLVRWLEQGEAPTSITASARGAGSAGGVNAEVPAGWAPGRTRPLCPWPQVPRYVGGDMESAASFRCSTS